jgi:predicted SPOUT superfamily RNA methylase MTH1
MPFQVQLIYFFKAPGYEELITALYLKGPYIMSDAVFGVKSSLIVVSFFSNLILASFLRYNQSGT